MTACKCPAVAEIGHIVLHELTSLLLRGDAEPPAKKAHRTEHVGTLAASAAREEEDAIVDALRNVLSNEEHPLFVRIHHTEGVVSFSYWDVLYDGSKMAPVHSPPPAIPREIHTLDHTIRVFLEVVSFTTQESNTVDNDAVVNANVSVASARQQPLHGKGIFMVGAGGIGCELIKNIVMLGCKDVTIIDLDTIDATNLNRQFLFRSEHVDRPKAVVVAEVMMKRDEGAGTQGPLRITAHHGNVKEPRFDVEFYQRFDIVLNGLDNMAARKHVNRMAMSAGVPVIESGTMGFNGQVQPIIKRHTECYDCRPKPADEVSFAVCTIHARPTTMVHCVHYAKELYQTLFGDVVMANATSGSGELSFTKEILISFTRGEISIVESCARLFHSLFVERIEQLLSMKAAETWSRSPPCPMKALCVPTCEESLLKMGAAQQATFLVSGATTPGDQDCLNMMCFALHQLLSRPREQRHDGMPFRKDDDTAVLFVATIASLRAACFNISRMPLEEVRSIAGSIVPAIATSNAIIAACVASQACAWFLNKRVGTEDDDATATKGLRFVYLRKAAMMRRRRTPDGKRIAEQLLLLHSVLPSAPNPSCRVCGEDSNRMVHVEVNITLHTIETFVNTILRRHLAFSSPCLAVGDKVLYEDNEFTSLAERPLSQFATCVTADGEDEEASASRESMSRTAFLIGSDLFQSLEWTLAVKHVAEFSDVATCRIDGVLFGGTHEDGEQDAQRHE